MERKRSTGWNEVQRFGAMAAEALGKRGSLHVGGIGRWPGGADETVGERGSFRPLKAEPEELRGPA